MGHRRLRAALERVEWREVDGEVVLVDLPSGRCMALNGSASLLWDALVQGTTFEQLVALLRTSYDLDAPTATADADAFLNQIADLGLLDLDERGSEA